MSRLTGFWGLIVKTNISSCAIDFFLEDLTSDFLHRGWRAAFCGYKIYSTFFTVDILHRSWSGLSLMCYKILQVVLWNFWTEIGGLPLLVSLQIWTTSLKPGKPLVSTLEWIICPLSLTSKDERRPTNPETCASGREAKMAFDNSL